MREKTSLWPSVLIAAVLLAFLVHRGMSEPLHVHGARSPSLAESQAFHPETPPQDLSMCTPVKVPTAVGTFDDPQQANATLTASLELVRFYVGEETGCELGFAVAGSGDVNGDGYAGVLVGAPVMTGSVGKEGLVYVFDGSSQGLPQTATLTLGAGQKGARFGAAVSSAGDVNGDGFADITVGAPEWKGGDLLSEAGAVFVYFGSDTGLSETWSWYFAGDRPKGKLGASVSSAGDVNGDGFDDLLVGAPYYGGSGTGAVYLFFGSASGPVTATVQIIHGERTGALFGASVASAGDVNGDGYADIIVGAPYHSRSSDLEREGAAFVYLGSAVGISVTASWETYGGQKGAHWGTAVTTIGDVNGDGYAGIAVGAPGYDGVEIDQGLVSVYYGRESGLPADPDWSYTFRHEGFRIGAALSAAGDINADGYADLLVGAPSYPATADGAQQNVVEAALIFLGSPTGLMNTYAWRLETKQSTTNFGAALCGAGRTNSDDFDDIIVGAPLYKSESRPYGRAFVYLGQAYVSAQDVVFLPMVLRTGP